MTALQMHGAGEYRLGLLTVATAALLAAASDIAATTPEEWRESQFRSSEALPPEPPVSHGWLSDLFRKEAADE